MLFAETIIIAGNSRRSSSLCLPTAGLRLTVAAGEALAGHSCATPASLTNAAIGGRVTPKLTFSFTG